MSRMDMNLACGVTNSVDVPPRKTSLAPRHVVMRPVACRNSPYSKGKLCFQKKPPTVNLEQTAPTSWRRRPPNGFVPPQHAIVVPKVPIILPIRPGDRIILQDQPDLIIEFTPDGGIVVLHVEQENAVNNK